MGSWWEISENGDRGSTQNFAARLMSIVVCPGEPFLEKLLRIKKHTLFENGKVLKFQKCQFSKGPVFPGSQALRMDCFPIYVHSQVLRMDWGPIIGIIMTHYRHWGPINWLRGPQNGLFSSICALTGPRNGLFSNIFQLLPYSGLISIWNLVISINFDENWWK